VQQNKLKKKESQIAKKKANNSKILKFQPHFVF